MISGIGGNGPLRPDLDVRGSQASIRGIWINARILHPKASIECFVTDHTAAELTTYGPLSAGAVFHTRAKRRGVWNAFGSCSLLSGDLDGLYWSSVTAVKMSPESAKTIALVEPAKLSH